MLRFFECSAGISGEKALGYYAQTSNRAVIGLLGLLLATPSGAFATTLYVSATSLNPQPPYNAWATAARNIQDAVDAAQSGDTVLVNDGVYSVGGRAVADDPSSFVVVNRAAIDHAITVKSVNGPEVTVIDGASAVRCVYVGNGALLSGFTLTRGTSQLEDEGNNFAGGVLCAANGVVTNCTLTGNDALFGGGAMGGTLYNCTLTNNTAFRYGGAYSATLYNCTLAGNATERSGGGAGFCILSNCTSTANSGGNVGGGGASDSTLYDCTLIGNSGQDGGGAYNCTLYNSTLKDNIVGNDGGGAHGSVLYNCSLIGNSAYIGGGTAGCQVYNCVYTGNWAEGGAGSGADILYSCLLFHNSAQTAGGGAEYSTLYNCTVVENVSQRFAGGVAECAVSNSIVYYNSAPVGPNHDDSGAFYSAFDYSCTTPLPSSGVGNIAQEPAFVDLTGENYRLQITSPCINAGLNQEWMVGATDLDGNPRISWGRVDMGAYEFLLPSSGPWKNHGQYVSAVTHVAQQFLSRRLITAPQMAACVSAAAKCDIGK